MALNSEFAPSTDHTRSEGIATAPRGLTTAFVPRSRRPTPASQPPSRQPTSTMSRYTIILRHRCAPVSSAPAQLDDGRGFVSASDKQEKVCCHGKHKTSVYQSVKTTGDKHLDKSRAMCRSIMTQWGSTITAAGPAAYRRHFHCVILQLVSTSTSSLRCVRP